MTETINGISERIALQQQLRTALQQEAEKGEAAAVPLSKEEVTQKALEALLKSFKLNAESLDLIRNAVKIFLEKGGESASSAPLNTLLKELLKNNAIAELKDLQNPVLLKELLSRGGNEQLSKQISEILLQRLLGKSDPQEQIKEVLRLIMRELDLLLLDLATEDSATGTQLIKSTQNPLFQNKDNNVLVDIKKIAPHIDKLLESLSKVDGDRSIDQKKLTDLFVSMVSAQRDIVASFEGRIKMLLTDSMPSNIYAPLMSALNLLKERTDQDGSSVGKLLNTFARSLSADIEQSLGRPIDAAGLRGIIEEGLRTLYQTFSLKPQSSEYQDIANGTFAIPAGLKSAVRLIESQLINILSDPHFADLAETTLVDKKLPDGLLAKLSQLQRDIKTLRELIPGQSQTLPFEERTEYLKLADIGERLSQAIEQYEYEGPQCLPVLRDTALRASQYLKEFIHKNSTPLDGEYPLNLIDSESLAQVGSLLASQEILVRMMPMMKSLGEPVLLLFPFIVGSMLHKAQISIDTPFVELSERDTQGEDGSSESFVRIKIRLPLSRIGEVVVDLAFRSGEMLINLGFENQHSAQFVDSRIDTLRASLQRLGFNKNQIMVFVSNDQKRDSAVVSDDLAAMFLERSSSI